MLFYSYENEIKGKNKLKDSKLNEACPTAVVPNLLTLRLTIFVELNTNESN